MTEGINYQVGRYFITMLLVAGVTFAGLNWLQVHQKVTTIQSGTINPNATIKEVIEQIQKLPEIQVMSGIEFSPQGASSGESTAVSTGEIPIISGSGMFFEQSVSNTGDIKKLNLDVMMKDLISNDIQANHEVAADDYREKFTQLCQTYQSVCDITSLDGDYTVKQKFSYQLMIVYMIEKLNGFGYNPLVSLRNLTVNNYTKNKRGYASAKIMVLNTYQMSNNKEFLQVLAHEMGHVIDLGVIVGSSKQIDSDYTEFGKAKFGVDDRSLAFYAISWSNEDTLRQNMTALDFASGYGMTNPFEDFAECHNMYQYHREVFAYLASTSRILKRKYEYFNDLYQGKYLSANFNPTSLKNLDIEARSWDTTRM